MSEASFATRSPRGSVDNTSQPGAQQGFVNSKVTSEGFFNSKTTRDGLENLSRRQAYVRNDSQDNLLIEDQIEGKPGYVNNKITDEGGKNNSSHSTNTTFTNTTYSFGNGAFPFNINGKNPFSVFDDPNAANNITRNNIYLSGNGGLPSMTFGKNGITNIHVPRGVNVTKVESNNPGNVNIAKEHTSASHSEEIKNNINVSETEFSDFENKLSIESMKKIEGSYNQHLINWYPVIKNIMNKNDREICHAIFEKIKVQKNLRNNTKILFWKRKFNKIIDSFKMTEAEENIVIKFCNTLHKYEKLKSEHTGKCKALAVQKNNMYKCYQGNTSNSDKLKAIKAFDKYMDNYKSEKSKIIKKIGEKKEVEKRRYNEVMQYMKDRPNYFDLDNFNIADIEWGHNSITDISLNASQQDLEGLTGRLQKLEKVIELMDAEESRLREYVAEKESRPLSRKDSDLRDHCEVIFMVSKFLTYVAITLAVVLAPAAILTTALLLSNPALLIAGIVLVSLYYGIPFVAYSLGKEEVAITIFLTPLVLIYSFFWEKN